MLDEVDTAAFAFSSIGAGKAAKATLLFGLENAVALGGVKSFDKVETSFKVGFPGGLVLSRSRPKPGLKSDNVKVFSGFRDTSSFLSAVPTLGVDMFALLARERERVAQKAIVLVGWMWLQKIVPVPFRVYNTKIMQGVSLEL